MPLSACCRKPATPDPDILAEVFPDGPPAGFRCFEGEGCEKCNGRGSQGRVAIVEYMEVDTDIRNAIHWQQAWRLRSLIQ